MPDLEQREEQPLPQTGRTAKSADGVYEIWGKIDHKLGVGI